MYIVRSQFGRPKINLRKTCCWIIIEDPPFWSNILKWGGTDNGEADEEDVSLKKRDILLSIEDQRDRDEQIS